MGIRVKDIHILLAWLLVCNDQFFGIGRQRDESIKLQVVLYFCIQGVVVLDTLQRIVLELPSNLAVVPLIVTVARALKLTTLEHLVLLFVFFQQIYTFILSLSNAKS